MADFKDILEHIEKSISKFNKNIPAAQQAMNDELSLELKKLDLKGGNIKANVSNLKLIARIKSKLNKLLLSDDYINEVKSFVKSFSEITTLQNEYWKSVEASYKPSALLKEIKSQAISDTVSRLTEAGIGTTIGDKISEILRTNITSGGSYKALQAQLNESLTDTDKSDGLLTKYSKQITTDSINTYSRNYNQVVSSDLGFEWYSYRGTEIVTSRPFCQSMVESRRYFHISEVPGMLRAEGMYYRDNKTDEIKKVEIYTKTGLPYGFIEGTNVYNFFIRAAGYQCAHQPSGVSEILVKSQAPEIYNRVINSSEYKNWKLLR